MNMQLLASIHTQWMLRLVECYGCQSIVRDILQDVDLQEHRCENLKSRNVVYTLFFKRERPTQQEYYV
jgi:hypothetical protein